jgi:hypothetical protein
MMRAAVVIAAFLTATGALAQGFNGPAEQPPAGFLGQQFIDSRGCAFVRAGIDGVTVWVPRLNRDRQPLCDFAPTFGAANRHMNRMSRAPASLTRSIAATDELPVASIGSTMMTVRSSNSFGTLK